MPKSLQPIFVTKSFLPPKEEFYRYIDEIFDSRILTNQGKFVGELERRLGESLNLSHVLACSNGTLALMLALRLAGLSGKKVITTPFTYVATLSAIMWEGCTPVFADIDAETLCMSPESLRECMKRYPDAKGVMPVHVFGNVCDVEAIEAICREFGLLCIYDACHAFGSSYKGRSALDYGDYSVCSFHATKLFHTVEGGCLVVHGDQDAHQARLLRAFGHLGDDHFCLGFNAKLSEIHAAMGLALLPQLQAVIDARRTASLLYDSLLLPDMFARPVLSQNLEYNYAYYPVLLDSEETLLALKQDLARQQIFTRRYFYPSLTTLPYLPDVSREPCPVTEDVALRVLCLPLSTELEKQEIVRITDAANGFFMR